MVLSWREYRLSLCPDLAAWCLTVSLASPSSRPARKVSTVVSTNSKAGPSFRRLRLGFLLALDAMGGGYREKMPPSAATLCPIYKRARCLYAACFQLSASYVAGTVL